MKIFCKRSVIDLGRGKIKYLAVIGVFIFRFGVKSAVVEYEYLKRFTSNVDVFISFILSSVLGERFRVSA